MLRITVPEREYWDASKEEFLKTKAQTLQLEHSLISLSKWEAKWNKAFLTKAPKTSEETLDYVRCMTLTQNVDPEVYTRLSAENIQQVNDYIGLPMTATTFRDEHGKPNRETITAEIIYYWMIINNIPFECQKWHLNRLLTLIRVCNIKNNPPKKRSSREIMASNAALNAARRKQFHTKG